ncbi:uncharacterized oxidoreductase YjmC [Patella vulgata]|uniref:uncharacterized oxidoreductase YjmC n=1 Tax=Patella vulgata TaxID=6465 RepID=UPI00217F4677|nr:uncharacterized oxidoreductase YjmC [Patella vulgata]
MAETEYVVQQSDLREFITNCMTQVGACPEHADTLAQNLLAADYRGHYSHGLNRLGMYMADIEQNMVETKGEPKILKQTVSTGLVDGNNLQGPVVGKFCMELAIQKAKETGIGWVTARHSNHFGIAGWYSMMALEHNLIGMAYCNTSPCMVPTRARKKVLGTNPISVAAPANNDDNFVLDMATTAVALGKVEIKHVMGQPIPPTWGVDNEGQVTTDPKAVFLEDGGLLPLGGTEETGGYKGYGLGMMVEVFCGILSGANFGSKIRHWSSHSEISNLGQCFVALDPSVFAPGFTDRMSDLMDHCRNLQPAEGSAGPVKVAGDPEREHVKKCDELGGIPYPAQQLAAADGLAKKCGVEPLKRLKAL